MADAATATLKAPDVHELTGLARWTSPREAGGAEPMHDLERSLEAFDAVEQAIDELASEPLQSSDVSAGEPHSGDSRTSDHAVANVPHVEWVVAPGAAPLMATATEQSTLVATARRGFHWTEQTESAQAATAPWAVRSDSANAMQCEPPLVLTVDFRTPITGEAARLARPNADVADNVRLDDSQTDPREPDGCEETLDRQNVELDQDRSRGVARPENADAVRAGAPDADGADQNLGIPTAQPPIRRYVAAEAEKPSDAPSNKENETPVTIRFPDIIASSEAAARRSTARLRDIGHLELYERLCDHLSEVLDPAGWRTIGWTGATDDDGKTTVVEALCRLWASQQRGEVLAVDAHPKAWGLSRRLGYDAPSGLADVLWGRVRWQKAVGRSLLDGLYVLPVGSGQFPAEADVEDCWPDLLAQWRREFRYVVVNIGHGASVPQAALGRYCDGLFFVVRPHETPRRDALRCVDRLRKAAARWVATVVVETAHGETA